jgi:hypothetical protein
MDYFAGLDRSVGAALTFNLPADRGLLIVKDIKGDASTYPITLTDPSGALIDGRTTLLLNTDRASAFLLPPNSGWHQIA